MIKINKLPRKTVLKIHKFALKLKKKKGFGQTKIAREIKEKLEVSISENTISGWINRHTVPYANEKTQFKSKPIPSKERLYQLYIKQDLSASKIGKRFNVSAITAINWLRKYKINTRTLKESMNTQKIKNELHTMGLKKPTKKYKSLTSEKAYILGVLCGDGYIDEKKIKLEIRKDKEFIAEFSDCLHKVYGLKYIYRYYAKRDSLILGISCMIMAKDLLSYGDFKTFTWTVPNKILCSNNTKILKSYLRGLYDSEGSVHKYAIALCSASYNGIKGISNLLNKLGIENRIKRGKYSMIYITRKKNLKLFMDIIGFTIKRKMQKLNNMYKLGW